MNNPGAVGRSLRPSVANSLRLVTSTVALAALGCTHPDGAVAPSTDAHALFSQLTVRERALNLSTTGPSDTVRLHVSAVFADDTPVPDAIVYTPGDSTITVDADGLVHAKFVTTNEAKIGIAVTHAGLTRRDSVRVQVRDADPAATASAVVIRFPNGAAPRVPIFDVFGSPGRQSLTIAALDQQGNALPDVLVDAHSSDTSIVRLDQSGILVPVMPGRATLHASTVAHGTLISDSVVVTVTGSLSATFEVLSPRMYTISDSGIRFRSAPWSFAYNNDHIQVASGVIVTWVNAGTTPVAVVFDDATHVDSVDVEDLYGPDYVSFGGIGNINPFGWDGVTDATIDPVGYYGQTYRVRLFSIPGTYKFTIIPQDATAPRLRGRIDVCPDSKVPCLP